MAHARLGPSNKRWPKCPGSVREEAVYPDTSSAAAIDGTGSHLLLESCLIHGVRAEAYLGQTIGQGDLEQPLGWFIQQDRVDRVQMCLDYISTRVYELGMQYDVGDVECDVSVTAETISNPGEAYGRDDWWGTCDITIEVKTRPNEESAWEVVFVEVADYKDGRSWVSEKNNTQLMSYLHGKTYELISCVHGMMTIIQPKVKMPIRSQVLPLAELQKEMDKMAAAAAATDAPDAPLIPGKHCNDFCKHKKNCIAYKTKHIEDNTMENSIVSGMGVIEQVTNHLSTLSPDDLSKILSVEKAHLDAFKKAKEEAIRRLETGHAVTGYTLAPGKASRVWNEDEETMVKKFKAKKLKQGDYYPPKLISPSQAEKLESLTDAQKKDLQKYVTTVAGKDTLKAVFVADTNPVEELTAGLPTPEAKPEPAVEPAPLSFM